MHFSPYPFKTNSSFLDFEFNSIGPKGQIRKVIRFTRISGQVFNVGFGDLDNETGEIYDSTVSNNNDSRKVLITVAAAIISFSDHYPDHWIFAKGSSRSRTRLYRIGITNYLEYIKKDFEIYGLYHDKWVLFERDHNYEAFLFRRK
ncbi:MAG: hypothetical protein NTW29_09840 [Bacteroidetes bacterium]|nr:hypothetical protein [Bacteroidota bacterium]